MNSLTQCPGESNEPQASSANQQHFTLHSSKGRSPRDGSLVPVTSDNRPGLLGLGLGGKSLYAQTCHDDESALEQTYYSDSFGFGFARTQPSHDCW